MSILDYSDFFVQSFKFVGAGEFVFRVDVGQPLWSSFCCQLSTSILPIVLIGDYFLSQLLFNAGHLDHSFIEFLILTLKFLYSASSLLSLKLPKLFLVLLRSVADVVVVTATRVDGWTCWVIHKVNNITDNKWALRKIDNRPYIDDSYMLFTYCFSFIINGELKPQLNDENFHYWNHCSRQNQTQCWVGQASGRRDYQLWL